MIAAGLQYIIGRLLYVGSYESADNLWITFLRNKILRLTRRPGSDIILKWCERKENEMTIYEAAFFYNDFSMLRSEMLEVVSSEEVDDTMVAATFFDEDEDVPF